MDDFAIEDESESSESSSSQSIFPELIVEKEK